MAASVMKAILAAVRGMDLNPLAVLTAKTNYLLSVLDLLDGRGETAVPIYTGDALSPAAGRLGRAAGRT